MSSSRDAGCGCLSARGRLQSIGYVQCHQSVSWCLPVKRAAVIGLIVVLNAAACSTAPRPRGTPDPGHKILDELTPVLSLIPSDSAVQYKHAVSPTWDSCDGARSTYGWTDVQVDAGFTTTSVPAVVLARARKMMSALGWREQPAAGTAAREGLVWLRVLDGGTTARAVLNPPGDPAQWSLSASAQPATRPVTGC